MPIIDDDTVFASGRINVITFDKHFKKHERDEKLKDKLKAENEISGIFNWCLEGLKKLREEGLTIPKEIELATAEYRKSNNKIDIFFKQELVKNGKNVTFADVFKRYCKWCEDYNQPFLSKSEFKEKLEKKNVLKKHATVKGKTMSNVVVGYELK